MDPTTLQKMAEKNGWSLITTKNARLISFAIKNEKLKRIRLNIYYTTGTVGICKPNQQEIYIRKQSKDDIERLFQSIAEGI